MMEDQWWMMDEGWWMMDDGWWIIDDGSLIMDDGWWMKVQKKTESKERTESTECFTFSWNILRRHFYETFWLDILMAFVELWSPVMTFEMVMMLMGWAYDSVDCLLY